jgi:UDP-N-acetylglucosamine--N-acetylmuramyl-(pentapeptide) pyrophosphoryl-undecaprenol N-acetylglucosamine transferase
MPSLLCDFPDVREQLARWQLLHLTGSDRPVELLSQAYAHANVPALVLPFCDRMGLAWAAASLAVSRAGAGSVAEAWANGVPTVFFPYPHHRDQHQKHNAHPVIKIGGGVLLEDCVDPRRNAAALARPLAALMGDAAKCQSMRDVLHQTWPGDGAAAVADWLEAAIRP